MTYWYGNASNIKSRVKYLKNSGFKNVSLHWCDDYEKVNGKKEDIYSCLEKNKIKINVFHLPFEDADDIWLNEEKGEQLYLKYLNVIKDADSLGIKNVVMHLTYKLKEISNFELGIKRVKNLLEEAEKRNIIIAFENLQHYDALELIICFSKYKSFGLCYDTGHFNIRPSDMIMNNLDKIKVVHLHNNYGECDTHNLLFDGNTKWDLLKQLINNSSVSIVLEIKNNYHVDEEEFLQQVKKQYHELYELIKK